MNNIFPHEAPYTIKSKFEEEHLESLYRDAMYLDEHSLSFEVVVPDWGSFKTAIQLSNHSLESPETGDDHGYRLFLEDIYQPIEVHQTIFASEYELRGKENNYGFRKIECRECERKELFFDQKARMYYCPACES
jgi:ribosomal protein S27E